MYNVHSEFDLKKHKEKFINYLEVVIEPNGKIHYAVPSHQLFLENMEPRLIIFLRKILQKAALQNIGVITLIG